MKSRRALARHVWSMAQTRAEAAGLVLSLQRSAVERGLAWYAVAAMAAMALMVSLLLLIAFGTPPEYRSWVLGLVSILLFVTAAHCAIHARQQLTRDAALVADFTKGLRLDLAMVNLALRDPAIQNEDTLAARQRRNVVWTLVMSIFRTRALWLAAFGVAAQWWGSKRKARAAWQASRATSDDT